MAIRSIVLQHYRSHEDSYFEFDPGANTIVGPNAAGKTNILEAIYFAAKGKSFQLPGTAGLIAHDQPWARIDLIGDYPKENRTVKLQRTPSGSASKEFAVDGTIYKRLSAQQSLPVVLFIPEHLTMVRGAPETRRSYVDGVASILNPIHASNLTSYKRAVSQRNALLKQAREYGLHGLHDQFFAWHAQLAELAVTITDTRQTALEKINETIEQNYQGIAGDTKQTLSLSLLQKEPITTIVGFKDAFDASLETDAMRGVTTVGPHRDDIWIELNGALAKETASRGETRSIVLALKYFEVDLVRASAGDISPLLLFDDVLSELDPDRAKQLLRVGEGLQKIITTTITEETDGVIQL